MDDSKTNDTCKGDDSTELGTPAQNKGASRFVPAWEGLRGMAVLMTCAAHTKPIAFRMRTFLGRSGVGMFFVLSGFLITGVLKKKQEQYSRGKKSVSYGHLGGFYLDRAVRLYPALCFMLCTTLLLAAIYTPQNINPKTFVFFGYSLFYMTDFYHGSPRGVYWQSTWSLAVEEQFYIFWSLALPLILALSFRKQNIVLTVLVLATSTLVYLHYSRLIQKQSIWIGYFAPLPNFSKMLLGAALQLNQNRLPKWLRIRAACWIGLSVLFIFGLSLLPRQPLDLGRLRLHPDLIGYSVWLEPVTAFSTTLMIIGSQSHGNILFESSVLRFAGRISYSLYLFQAPLFWIRHHLSEMPSGYDAFAFNCTAVMFASFSTICIEEPLREKYHHWQTRKHQTGSTYMSLA